MPIGERLPLPPQPIPTTFIAVDSDIQLGSVNGQPLQDAPDSGIALWPETSPRDLVEEIQPAASPDQGQHDDRHQVIEPTDQSFGADTGHLPQAPDLDLNLNSGSVSPDRPGEPGPQNGPIDPSNGHHSFGAQDSTHFGTTAAHRVDDENQSGDLDSDRSALNGDSGRLGTGAPFEPEEEGEDLDEDPLDETRDLLIPVPIGAPNAKSGAPRSLARSPKTEHQYDGRVRLIWRRSVDKRSPDPQQPVVVNPLEVTQDFLHERSALSPASWNLYRAALLWHLAQHRHDNELYEQAYQLFSSTNADAKQRKADKTRKGSSKRSIPEDHLNKLLDTLAGMNRHVNWGSRTSFWLQAGLAAGARPGEWFGSNWLDESQTVLCIPNGKRKTTVPIFSIVGPGQTIPDRSQHRHHQRPAGHAQRALLGQEVSPALATHPVQGPAVWQNADLPDQSHGIAGCPSTTLASIGDAVIATDRHGFIALINAVAQRLTGWTEIEAIGRPFNEANEGDAHLSTHKESEGRLGRFASCAHICEIEASTRLC